MKNSLPAALLLFTLLTGCQKNALVSPDAITICPPAPLVTRDSIYAGTYLGMSIQDSPEAVYAVIQTLRQTQGVSYLNVVSNSSSDLTQLRNRIPLYQYMLLDQTKGTDSGVQITLESGQVKSLYLNSGQPLTQWPTNAKANASVRLGDPASALYDKFVQIRSQREYANKFERISLLTKDLSSAYDRAMSQSPQWYFTHATGTNRWDEVQVYFRDGKVSHIHINHYQG